LPILNITRLICAEFSQCFVHTQSSNGFIYHKNKRDEVMNVSYVAHISGKVQGVYFRASSQQMAIEYSVSGYARNLTDGDVEVLLCGEKKNVDKMLRWLNHGPSSAKVSQVKSKQIPWQEHNHFSIG
jgi:acylphosphatase